MISRKPNALVYVHRSGLLIAGKHIERARLAFPEEVVSHMEILQPEAFAKLCRQFFDMHGLQRKRVLMVLDNDLLFTKKIELGKTGNPDALTDAFIAAMPFEPSQRACLTIQAKSRLQLLATNARIYQATAEALHASGIAKLCAITPVAAYDLRNTERKADALVEHLLKNTHISKAANFLSTASL